MELISVSLVLHMVAFASFAVATVVTFHFWIAVKNEKYWVGVPLATLMFLLHIFFEILEGFSQDYETFLDELLEVLSALALTYAAFGLGRIVRNIRTIMDEEDSPKD